MPRDGLTGFAWGSRDSSAVPWCAEGWWRLVRMMPPTEAGHHLWVRGSHPEPPLRPHLEQVHRSHLAPLASDFQHGLIFSADKAVAKPCAPAQPQADPHGMLPIIPLLSGALPERVTRAQSYSMCKCYATARVGCQRGSCPPTDRRRACRRGQWRGHRGLARPRGMGRAVHMGVCSVGR